MAQRTVEATLVLDAAEIPAKGHLIISKVRLPKPVRLIPTTGSSHFSSNAIHGIWAGMPDLEALFE